MIQFKNDYCKNIILKIENDDIEQIFPPHLTLLKQAELEEETHLNDFSESQIKDILNIGEDKRLLTESEEAAYEQIKRDSLEKIRTNLLEKYSALQNNEDTPQGNGSASPIKFIPQNWLDDSNIFRKNYFKNYYINDIFYREVNKISNEYGILIFKGYLVYNLHTDNYKFSPNSDKLQKLFIDKHIKKLDKEANKIAFAAKDSIAEKMKEKATKKRDCFNLIVKKILN